MRTQVGIVGAGPAGLLLSHLLARRGIDSVVLESRDRAYVEKRVRAGVCEQGTVDILRQSGVGDRMDREGLVHEGIELRFDGTAHRIDFPSLTGGRRITVYGQQEIVKDLIEARLAAGGALHFEAPATHIGGADGAAPTITFEKNGATVRMTCDFVAACDGFHGIGRDSVPKGVLSVFERVYPMAWLGVLAEAKPSSEEIIYAHHERGFALHSMRSPTLSRNYVQVPLEDTLEDWPEERFWREFEQRMTLRGGFEPSVGPVVEKSIASMRSFVVEPMQWGRLFLVGDAAHIVPPTGAKGMNLAVADVKVLDAAFGAYYDGAGDAALRQYSRRCLSRVWRAQHFSWWMTRMLHRFPNDDAYSAKLQLSELAYVCNSDAAARSLAENYVGWDYRTTTPA